MAATIGNDLGGRNSTGGIAAQMLAAQRLGRSSIDGGPPSREDLAMHVFGKSSIRVGIAALAIAVGSCSTDDPLPTPPDRGSSDATADANVVRDGISDFGAAADLAADTRAPLDNPGDADVRDGSDDAGAVDCEAEPGAFSCPCRTGDDCNSAACVPSTLASNVCTRTCVAGCPDGWRCALFPLPGGEPVFVCLEEHIQLCRPCRTNEACREGSVGRPEDRCVDYGPALGAFCASGCDEGAPCPDGYVCEARLDVEGGGPTSVCVKADGSCECSGRAIVEGAATDCRRDQCAGRRVCAADGLTECDAPVPADEVCDGVDNDCDGVTDEEGASGCAEYYRDGDADRYGSDTVDPRCLCGPDNGGGFTATRAGDCDDGLPGVHPEATEACNGVDDDCDGTTDARSELLGDPCDGDDDDLCARGTWTCREDGLDVECVNETVRDLIEACNGLDDDCDGRTDEDFPSLRAPCDGDDPDLCAQGVWACAPDGASVICTGDGTGDTTERCDGVDNDCDGETDEAFPMVGAPCDGPDDDRCAEGRWACAGDGLSTVCAGDGQTDTTERCDGVDNDCDGGTDEDFADLGAPCDGPDADACAHGERICAPGGDRTVCGAETQTDLVERCDGVDNDCDGDTDEGFARLGEPCDGDDDDRCANGIIVCNEAGDGTLCGPESPAGVIERCNGLDDDCDDLTDEDFGRLGAACDGDDPDQCAGGRLECTDDGLGTVCRGDGGDTIERCDGVDNDCDNVTDEGFEDKGMPCDGPDADQCATGTWACSADGLRLECSNEASPDQRELCNGLDDDCDGDTDEGYPLVGSACDGDDGDECANGTWSCTPDGAAVECVNESPRNVTETCNGADDDCDGRADEDFPDKGTPCDGDDADACRFGFWTCAPDGAGLHCVNESRTDIAEQCNGRDDDCDGDTDEDFGDLGMPCDGDDADRCANGAWQCTPDGSGLHCPSETVSDIAELCNDADDDCDGATDEDFGDKGMPCDGPDGDACAEGRWVCDGTRLVCDDATGTIPELCNGADDDCDGETDERAEFADKGQPCDGPDGDQCKNGTFTCSADGQALTCNNEVIVDRTESCNGVDDDCNGAIDDDPRFALKGEACDGADSDRCRNGTWTCNFLGDGVECTNESVTDIRESCNELDDDCDNLTDEDYPDKGDPCDSAADADTCPRGRLTCNARGSGLECTGDSAAPTVEILADPGFDGFEDDPLTWRQSPSTLGHHIWRDDEEPHFSDAHPRPAPRSARYLAWLGQCGAGCIHWVDQKVTIPASTNSLKIRLWVQVETDEASCIGSQDQIIVRMLDADDTNPRDMEGYVLCELIGPADDAWYELVIDVSASQLTEMKGREQVLRIVGSNDSVAGTSFFIDDVSLEGTVCQ